MAGICFCISGCSLLLLLMLTGNDFSYNRNSNFDNFILHERTMPNPNPDNKYAALANGLMSEEYFDNDILKAKYYLHEKEIKETAQENCKKLIFEKQIENEISGEWFLSRIDGFTNFGSDTILSYSMTFIKRTITKYVFTSLFHYTDQREKEYCRLNCNFIYKNSTVGNPFEFYDIDVEYL